MALPFACLSFTLKPGTFLPDPYAANAADNSFLRNLYDVPSSMLPRLLSRDGSVSTVDSGQLIVAELPPLLCGWRPDLAAEDNVELLARVATLEQRVAELERENTMLRSKLETHYNS